MREATRNCWTTKFGRVAVDEFHRKALFEFTSRLQIEVDRLAGDADEVRGGLVGSIHTERAALPEDRCG